MNGKKRELVELINKIGQEIITFKTTYDVSKIIADAEETLYLLLQKMSIETEVPFNMHGVVEKILKAVLIVGNEMNELKYDLEDTLDDIEVLER